MGYQVPQGRTYLLRFESPVFEGLEVEAAGLSVDEYERVLFGMSYDQAMALFADRLIRWNVEDNEGPVAADLEHLRAQPADWARALVAVWADEVANVAPLLLTPSSNGSAEAEALGLTQPAPPQES